MSNPSEHNRHNSPSSIQQESDHEVSGTVSLILDDQGHAYGKRENAYKRFANGVKRFWARIDHGERWMIFLTAIVAFTTVSQAVQSCNNNKSTAVQVDRLIDAANRVDDAAESFSRSASGINGGVSDAVTKLQGQADKMDAARTATEDQSREALQATMDGFHNEDRAWVGISETKPLSYTTDPKTHRVDMTVAFTYKNYGRSAAQHVRFIAELKSDMGDIKIPCQKLETTNYMEDVLLPTQDQTLNWAMNLSNAQIEEGWSHQNPQLLRTLFLRVEGCIEYTDKDKESTPHRTPFSYLVFWTKSYITADTITIPAVELELTPYGINPNTGRVR